MGFRLETIVFVLWTISQKEFSLSVFNSGSPNLPMIPAHRIDFLSTPACFGVFADISENFCERAPFVRHNVRGLLSWYFSFSFPLALMLFGAVESLWYFHFFQCSVIRLFNSSWNFDLRCFTLASFPRVASGCFFLSCSLVVLEEFRWPMLRFMNSSISVMPFLTSTEMFRWTLHFLKVASNFLSSFSSLFLSVR